MSGGRVTRMATRDPFRRYAVTNFYHLNYALRVQLRRAEPPGTIGRPPKTWGKKVGWQRFQLRQPTPRRSPKWLPIENSIAPKGPGRADRGGGVVLQSARRAGKSHQRSQQRRRAGGPSLARRFDMNRNHFQLAMLAYNLNCWLLLFNREAQASVETLRHTTLATARLRFLFVAAKIWRHAGRTGCP